MSRRKLIFRLSFLVVIAGLVIAIFYGLRYFRWIYSTNTTGTLQPVIIDIPTGSSFDALKDSLVRNRAILHQRSFTWVAGRMNFTSGSVKGGRYLIEPGMNNRDLVHKLRLGDQYPVQLVINTAHTVPAVSGKIASQLEMDSISLLAYLQMEYLPESSYNQNTLLSLFIPNTYEVYWNISPAAITSRMEVEHENFWNGDRLQLATALNMTPVEIYILASIIERETHIDSERRTISAVYHNRLQKGIPLQADPTVLFAIGDPTITRVLHKHLEVESPYNTYRHSGLPPGPIAMPSMASLMAALNPSEEDYLYFCARPGGSGHAFAKTLTEHNRNARAYQQWLNSNGIR